MTSRLYDCARVVAGLEMDHGLKILTVTSIKTRIAGFKWEVEVENLWPAITPANHWCGLTPSNLEFFGEWEEGLVEDRAYVRCPYREEVMVFSKNQPPNKNHEGYQHEA